MNALDEKDVLIAKLQFELAEAQAKIIELESVYGKDEPIILQIQDYWVVQTHRRNRDTNKVITESHRVTSDALNNLYKTIIKLSKTKSEPLEPMEMWEELVRTYGVNMDLNAFNGGKNRSPIYFPYYYYPMKILEHQKLVHYGGGGKTSLLDPHRKLSAQKINLVSSLFQ